MSKLIQFILGNPILIIIILGGVFNAAVRLSQKTKEQRAKRDVSLESARKKHDAIRTGRSTKQPHQAHPQQAHPDPQQAQSKPTVAQVRQQRIEALRQERMAQLRALREKRAGSPTPSSSTASTGSNPPLSTFTHPSLPPIPAQNPQHAPQAQRTPSPRPVQFRTPAQPSPAHSPAQASGQIHRIANQSAPHQPRRPRVVAPATKKVQTSPFVHQKSQAKQARRPKQGAASAYATGATGSVSDQSRRSARSMLHDRSSIRQAMILSEILDAPIALRDQDVSSGSLFH